MYSWNALVCWRMVTSACVFLLLWLPLVQAKAAKPDFEVKGQSGKRNDDAIYCTVATENMDACTYSGASFPGGSAVDSVLRSRFLGDEVPFQWDGGNISASSIVPGLAPDVRMEYRASNFYLAYRKILRATAYLDHFLCSDKACENMVDIFWHKNATDGKLHALSRFSYIPGTRYALPIWGFGKDRRPPECDKVYGYTEEKKYFKWDAEIENAWRCHWEIPEGAAVISTSPFLPRTQYVAKSLVDRLDGRFNVSYGTFRTRGGKSCVTLIIPVDEEMEKWGWTSSDGCTDPEGVYLFDSYFMLAYIDPTALDYDYEGGTWNAAATAGSESQLVANTLSWLRLKEDNDSLYYGYLGRGMRCEENSPALRMEYDCYVSDMATAGTDDFGSETGNRTMLVIGGKPLWVLILNETWKDRAQCSSPFRSNLDDQSGGGVLGRAGLAFDIYRSTSGPARPWCTPAAVVHTNKFAPQYVPNVTLHKGAPPVNLYDCEQTAELLTLQVKFEGGPLKDISELAQPATSQCLDGLGIFNMAGKDRTFPNVVESAMNDTLNTAKYLLKRETEKNLATADPVATDWGAANGLVLALLTTFAAVLGAKDVYDAGVKKLEDLIGKNYDKTWNLVLGFLVVGAVGIAALAPPIGFFVLEHYARENNPNSDEETGPTVLWAFAGAQGPHGKYQVVTAVAVTFESPTMVLPFPFGISAIVVAALGTVWTAVIVWNALFHPSTDNSSTDNSSTDNSSTDNSSTDNSSTDKPSTDHLLPSGTMSSSPPPPEGSLPSSPPSLPPWNLLRSFVLTRWRAKAFTHSYSRHHNVDNDVP